MDRRLPGRVRQRAPRDAGLLGTGDRAVGAGGRFETGEQTGWLAAFIPSWTPLLLLSGTPNQPTIT